MGANQSILKAICPHCKFAVGLRPGLRLLKHGYRGSTDPKCPHGGMKVTDADVLAWCRREVAQLERYVSMDRDTRVRLECAVANAKEKEQNTEAELKAAQEILAEYQAKVTT